MEDEIDAAQALIESAMSGVAVIQCPICYGKGKIPEALDVRCPKCEGAGRIVQPQFNMPNGYNAGT